MKNLRYLRKFYLSASAYDAACLESSTFLEVVGAQYSCILKDANRFPSSASRKEIATARAGAAVPVLTSLGGCSGGSVVRLSSKEVEETLHCSMWRDKGMHYAVSFVNERAGDMDE